MKNCLLMVTDAGNGHRSCAESLRAELAISHPDYKITIINPYKTIFKSNAEDFYNRSIVGNHLFFLTPLMILFLNCALTVMYPFLIWKLKRFFLQEKPDIVISLMPYLNGVYRLSLNHIDHKIPFCVILTDWSDAQKMWVNSIKNQIFFCNTPHAKSIIKRCKHPDENIHLISGMILKRAFYDLSPIQINYEKEKLNLSKEKFTILMMYGIGSNQQTIDFFKSISYLKDKIQFILLCGNNTTLKSMLSTTDLDVQVTTIGFTNQPSIYFKISDLFVGKPGPGSLAEALHLKLPIITELNLNTVAQERFNAQYVSEKGYGLIVRHLSTELNTSIEKCLNPTYYLSLKKNISEQKNEGIFDIIEQLKLIMK